jgi:hypothetical protein
MRREAREKFDGRLLGFLSKRLIEKALQNEAGTSRLQKAARSPLERALTSYGSTVGHTGPYASREGSCTTGGNRHKGRGASRDRIRRTYG